MSAFILSFIWGVGLHQFSPITRHMPNGWEQLASPAIGVVGTSPMVWLWLRKLKGTENPVVWAISAFFLAFLGVGTGVAFGYLLDTLFGKEKS